MSESSPLLKIGGKTLVGPPTTPARWNALVVLHGLCLTRVKVAWPRPSGNTRESPSSGGGSRESSEMVHSIVPDGDIQVREAGKLSVTAGSARDKRARTVSILGAEKALGKRCIGALSRRSRRRRTAAPLRFLLPRERVVEIVGNWTVRKMRAECSHQAPLTNKHDSPMGQPRKVGTSA